MITVSLPLYLLILANAAIVVAATFAVLRVEKLLSTSKSFWSSPVGANLSGTFSTEGELDHLVEEVQALRKSVDELSVERAPPQRGQLADMSFGRAVRMAKQGSSVDDLTESFGLSLGEAQLLQRIHGPAAAATEDARGVGRDG